MLHTVMEIYNLCKKIIFIIALSKNITYVHIKGPLNFGSALGPSNLRAGE
jgi:hypothetical protein